MQLLWVPQKDLSTNSVLQICGEILWKCFFHSNLFTLAAKPPQSFWHKCCVWVHIFTVFPLIKKSKGEADSSLTQCPRDQGIPSKSLSETIKHIIPEIFSPKGCCTARSLTAAAWYWSHGSVQSCIEWDDFIFFAPERKTCRNQDSIYRTHEMLWGFLQLLRRLYQREYQYFRYCPKSMTTSQILLICPNHKELTLKKPSHQCPSPKQLYWEILMNGFISKKGNLAQLVKALRTFSLFSLFVL